MLWSALRLSLNHVLHLGKLPYAPFSGQKKRRGSRRSGKRPGGGYPAQVSETSTGASDRFDAGPALFLTAVDRPNDYTSWSARYPALYSLYPTVPPIRSTRSTRGTRSTPAASARPTSRASRGGSTGDVRGGCRGRGAWHRAAQQQRKLTKKK